MAAMFVYADVPLRPSQVFTDTNMVSWWKCEHYGCNGVEKPGTGTAHPNHDAYVNGPNRPDTTEGTNQSTSLKEDTRMSAQTELVRAMRTPDERFMRDYSITNDDGSIATYGKDALLQWLFEANKTEFIAALRTAYKTNANAQAADRAATSAD